MHDLKTVDYRDGALYFLDTRRLPEELVYNKIDSVEACYDAIKTLQVRGAPAIGVAAAYGLLVAAKAAEKSSFEAFYRDILAAKERLASSRPTAVNLFWALERVDKKVIAQKQLSPNELVLEIEREAAAIQSEDAEMCRRIGEHGLTLLRDGMGVLTHCNAGALAASRYGTALAPIYLAHEQGMKLKVFADETRPLLQGARLTAYELYHAGIDVTLICDNMAAAVMQSGWVQAVMLGCDRIAANGDVANKIGTYGVAVLAKHHGIPFYVVGPTSTIDMSLKSGDLIPIEERGADEIIRGMGKLTAPEGVNVYNPAFDVTPHELISGIVTEKGIITPPFEANLLNI